MPNDVESGTEGEDGSSPPPDSSRARRRTLQLVAVAAATLVVVIVVVAVWLSGDSGDRLVPHTNPSLPTVPADTQDTTAAEAAFAKVAIGFLTAVRRGDCRAARVYMTRDYQEFTSNEVLCGRHTTAATAPLDAAAYRFRRSGDDITVTWRHRPHVASVSLEVQPNGVPLVQNFFAF